MHDILRIATLPPRQRAVVEAVCVGDLTSDEIARRLGIAVSTVKRHRTAILLRFSVGSMYPVCRWYGAWRERQESDEVREIVRTGRGMRAGDV